MKEADDRGVVLKYLNYLVKWRLFLFKFVIIVAGVSVIISVMITPRFTAKASILPPSAEQESMMGLLTANLPSGIAGLSRLAGALPGTATQSDLFAAIMESDRIQGEIIKKFDLMREFRVRTYFDASRKLTSITNIEVSGEGIISVSVEYKNKYLAADIANAYIEQLDKFNTETAMTLGKKYRMFVEQRLRATTDSLGKAEDSLRQFQEKHRTVALDAEIEQAIETIAKLKGEIILREVQRGAALSASEVNNPYIQSIDQELRELRTQLRKIESGSKIQDRSEFGAGFSVPLSQMPEIALEYARLVRNVKIQEAVYEVLTQHYEQAKIMELKDTPTVQFLDRASPPEKKSYPRRVSLVVFCTITGFLVGLFLVFLLEYIHILRERTSWVNIKETLSQDLSKLLHKTSVFKNNLRR